MLIDRRFELRMFFSCRYAALALPIRTSTSASDPSCSSMMLHRYVKVSTSPKSPSKVNRLAHAVLYRRILIFYLRMLRPTATEAAATLVVFSCICCCVCDRRARTHYRKRLSQTTYTVLQLKSYLEIISNF
ncbi:unnamed protein product [Schistosoma mattheei]|uniref:Uncharacterized protein n=1 Tax=Schistosoma mattheei TaxID=31246 RepID=A0A183NPU9_9TREM|nr:unnamed protein product [Schistosoma mattheei]